MFLIHCVSWTIDTSDYRYVGLSLCRTNVTMPLACDTHSDIQKAGSDDKVLQSHQQAKANVQV